MKGDHWRPLNDDITLRKYSHPLQALAHAVLLTVEDKHSCRYKFPLTDSDKVAATTLMDQLLNGNDGSCVKAFHEFVVPFLSGREFSANYDHAEYSKWQEVLECFLAIYCLKEDGNFKPPQDVTGIFAKIEYLCRGTTLYQGLSHMADFRNDPYK